MPTITGWIAPDAFMVHKDVTVYHTYTNDDFYQGRHPYRYTLDGDSDDSSFDVRALEVDCSGMLEKHPPFLTASLNPEFEHASAEQIAEWKAQWKEWRKEGGGLESAIKAVISAAIDKGLLIPPTQTEGELKK